MSNQRSQTTRWFYGMPLLHGFVYRLSTFILAVIGVVWWRARYTGFDCIPDTEPFLLLPNHTSMLDPFWIGAPTGRGMKSMASAGLFQVPFVGAYLRMIGCFPKKKFTKDRESMQTLQNAFDDGYGVMIFPEGNRSWNGETTQIQPGIGRLIKRLGCKVVYGRLNSAYLFQPRWAKYPRWVPIEGTYDGPYEYGEELTVEEITADVQAKVSVVPHLKKPAKVWGFRMAHGLRQYLWACPDCHAMESLGVAKDCGNTIRCDVCESRWKVDVYSMLNGERTLSVADAFRELESHFGMPPIEHRERFEESEVALTGAEAALFQIPQGTNETVAVASGEVQLHSGGLRMMDDSGVEVWSASFDILKAISVEWGNLLHFRIDGQLYRLIVPADSPLKWDYFLCKWREHVVGSSH
jgi:1-acyl-sn-glycerol-3-phosphate acyltransferase